MAQLANADVSTFPESSERSEPIRIPQITIDAFWHTLPSQAALQRAVADRRMARAQCRVHAGGLAGALSHYQQTRSPNLAIIETHSEQAELTRELDALADICDPATKVIIIGRINDVCLYRTLLDRGVSEYLLSPVDPLALIRVIARLYRQDAKRLGRSVAFIGAKGGAGSSVIAHNVAAALGRIFSSKAILADMDLPFGRASIGFNLDPAQGIEEVVKSEDRVDDVLLERLLANYSDHLDVLPAPALLDYSHTLPEGTFERLLEVAQASVPFVVLDLPHVWAPWTKQCLIAADEVVVTATPELASLRNAKNLIELLAEARPNDTAPKLVLNQTGMPKRSEIPVSKFKDVLQIEPVVTIPFEPAGFSTAENTGKTIAECSSKSTASGRLNELAIAVSGRLPPQQKARALSFARLWGGR